MRREGQNPLAEANRQRDSNLALKKLWKQRDESLGPIDSRRGSTYMDYI